jgi:hypothetical protein
LNCIASYCIASYFTAGEIAIEDGGDLTERFLAAHGKDWGLLERAEIITIDR